MKNEKLLTMMEARGINKKTLSKLTGIPASTLSRIINEQVKHVKASQMQSIALALKTSVHNLFDIPMEQSIGVMIRPDEAGEPITKLLSPDESMLLYWYQNSSEQGRFIIYERAKSEYEKTLVKLHQKANEISSASKNDFAEQLTLDFLE